MGNSENLWMFRFDYIADDVDSKSDDVKVVIHVIIFVLIEPV